MKELNMFKGRKKQKKNENKNKKTKTKTKTKANRLMSWLINRLYGINETFLTALN